MGTLCRPGKTARYQMRGCQGSNIGLIFVHVAFADEMLLQCENAQTESFSFNRFGMAQETSTVHRAAVSFNLSTRNTGLDDFKQPLPFDDACGLC